MWESYMDKQYLQNLIHSELYDWNGLVRIMGENSELINDIPAYQEQLETLKNVLANDGTVIQQGICKQDLASKISEDQIYTESNKLVLIKDYLYREMKFDFFWLVQSFPKHLHDEKGKFILMYSLEEKEEETHIFPEWFSLFAFGKNYEDFFAAPAFYSVLEKNNLTLTDFSEAALYRAQTYGIWTEKQIQKLCQSHSEIIRSYKNHKK